MARPRAAALLTVSWNSRAGTESAAGRAYNLADCYARWADWARWTSELLRVDVEIDTSSPEQPKNTFTKDAAGSLGVALDRGHEGIRAHLRELIAQMAADRV